MWLEEVGELVLVHGLRKVGHVEVGVTFVGEGLELRVEGLAGEADLVTQVVEATDTVLGVLVVVVLDEAKATSMSAGSTTTMCVSLTPCRDQC